MNPISNIVIGAIAVAFTSSGVLAQSGNSNTDSKPVARHSELTDPQQMTRPADLSAIHFHKLDTKNYVIELPEGWEAGQETPFGQREIRPAKDVEADHSGSMSSMTGPGLGKQSWEQLYQTSLFFITRYAANGEKMSATPYKLGKSRQGFETCSWTMNNAEGHPLQRLVILKHTNGNILALSVKIPVGAAKETQAKLDTIFDHIVSTAVVR